MHKKPWAPSNSLKNLFAMECGIPLPDKWHYLLPQRGTNALLAGISDARKRLNPKIVLGEHEGLGGNLENP
jgi:hypothetical protein